MPLFAELNSNVAANALACGLAVFLLGIAFHGKNRLSGTTLAAPCLWVAISALCFAVLSISLLFASRDEPTPGKSAMRFAAAASTLCPLIAVLGAKRPQDCGWQWVVFTLWVIVVWPAVQASVKPMGDRLELFATWKLFLWALMAMGPLNYLATRHWFAAIASVVGQILVFGEFLGLWEPNPWQLPMGLGCFLLAAVLIALRQPLHLEGERRFPRQTQRWLQFRDAFGAFWGLRIMQRVNETAALRHWPVELTWLGFERTNEREEGTANGDVSREIDQSLDTLLRRFL